MVSCPTDRMKQPRDSEAAPLSPAAVAGEAIFSGCVSRIKLPRRDVAATLPRRVGMRPGSAHDYACLLVFGEQANGATFFGGVPMRWSVRYHELMVAVPFVTCEGLAGQYLFIAGMACDFPPAAWNGNVFYGFRKRVAAMDWTDSVYCAGGESGTCAFRATLGPARTAIAMNSLNWICGAAALPVLGERDDHSLVRSSFEWDLGGAAVDPAAARINVEPTFREMPPGTYASSSSTLECYRVDRMRWRLGWPAPADVAGAAERR